MIKIWGRPTSICTQRVLWALTEAELEYEFILASATMGHAGHVSTGVEPYGVVNTPAYRAMNPNGTIPTIDDGGFILWESNAILTYLALTHGQSKLGGADATTLARACQWMAWTNEHLEPPLHVLVMELSRLRPELRSPHAVGEAVDAIKPWLLILDHHLERNAFVTGQKFSIGDIPPAAAAYRFQLADKPGPPTPNVKRWLQSLAMRDGFIRHVAPPGLHFQ